MASVNASSLVSSWLYESRPFYLSETCLCSSCLVLPCLMARTVSLACYSRQLEKLPLWMEALIVYSLYLCSFTSVSSQHEPLSGKECLAEGAWKRLGLTHFLLNSPSCLPLLSPTLTWGGDCGISVPARVQIKLVDSLEACLLNSSLLLPFISNS